MQKREITNSCDHMNKFGVFDPDLMPLGTRSPSCSFLSSWCLDFSSHARHTVILLLPSDKPLQSSKMTARYGGVGFLAWEHRGLVSSQPEFGSWTTISKAFCRLLPPGPKKVCGGQYLPDNLWFQNRILQGYHKWNLCS